MSLLELLTLEVPFREKLITTRVANYKCYSCLSSQSKMNSYNPMVWGVGKFGEFPVLDLCISIFISSVEPLIFYTHFC